MTEPARAGRLHSCCGTCNGPETRLGLATVNHGRGRDSQGRAHRIKLLPDQLLTYSGEHQTPVASFNPTVTQMIDLFKFSGPKKHQQQNPHKYGRLVGRYGGEMEMGGRREIRKGKKEPFLTLK